MTIFGEIPIEKKKQAEEENKENIGNDEDEVEQEDEIEEEDDEVFVNEPEPYEEDPLKDMDP